MASTVRPYAPPAPANDQARNTLATRLAAVYVFLLISRIFEFAAAFGLGNLYLMLLTSTLGIVVAALTGGLFRCFRNAPAKWLIGFAVCTLLATAASTWHMGSLDVIKGTWLRSMLAFLVVAGSISSPRQLRAVVFAAGYGGLVAALALLALGGGSRLSFMTGTFSNANEVAYHLLYVLPMCGYILVESGKFRKVLMLVAAACTMIVVLRTGSRGGLLIIAAQFLMVLTHVSIGNKVKALLAGTIVAVLLVTIVPHEAMMRYATLAGSDITDGSFASAEQSKASRILHLRESLQITLQHPLFGVGPGVFRSASAEVESTTGEHQFWEETHNAYTQVSSECGIPGLICFVGVLFASWRLLSRAEKIANQEGAKDIANMMFCLKLTLVAFIVNGFFTSDAYEYYLPLFVAFMTAIPMVRRAPEPVTATPRLMTGKPVRLAVQPRRASVTR